MSVPDFQAFLLPVLQVLMRATVLLFIFLAGCMPVETPEQRAERVGEGFGKGFAKGITSTFNERAAEVSKVEKEFSKLLDEPDPVLAKFHKEEAARLKKEIDALTAPWGVFIITPPTLRNDNAYLDLAFMVNLPNKNPTKSISGILSFLNPKGEILYQKALEISDKISQVTLLRCHLEIPYDDGDAWCRELRFNFDNVTTKWTPKQIVYADGKTQTF